MHFGEPAIVAVPDNAKILTWLGMEPLYTIVPKAFNECKIAISVESQIGKGSSNAWKKDYVDRLSNSRYASAVGNKKTGPTTHS